MEEKFCFPCDEPVREKEAPCPSQCKSPLCPAYKPRNKKYRVEVVSPASPPRLRERIERPKPSLEGKVFVWVIGGPKSGKMTQCKKIAGKFGLTLLCVGDLIKAEIKANPTLDQTKCLISVSERQVLAPNETVLTLLRKAIEAKADNTPGFVIFDFPREERQGKQFDETIAPVTVIFYLEASDELMRSRTMQGITPTDKQNEVFKIRLKDFKDRIRNIIAQYPHRIYTLKAELGVEEIFNEISIHMTKPMENYNQKMKEKADKEATKPLLGMNLVKK